MARVRIIGGGLTGILAAFEAHRLGAREIVLEDALDRLGGWSLPRVSHGVELRDGEFAFGPAQDPIRQALEWRGVAFDEADLHDGAISPSPTGPRASWGEGPVLPAEVSAPAAATQAETLNDILRAYPRSAADPLASYCQWRLGVWLDQVHASAAPALGLHKVRLAPVGDTATANVSAPRRGAVPRDGLNGLFASASRALTRLGVEIRLHSLVSPREAAQGCAEDETVVWAADPLPLFDLAAQKAPKPRLIGERVASYVFRARLEAPLPLTVRNYTGEGKVSTLRVYESRGETLVSVECVDEVGDECLRAEVLRLLAPFARRPMILDACVLTNMRTRFACPSVEAVQRLNRLEAELAHRFKGRFIVAGWESADAGARIADLTDRMTRSLGPAVRIAAVA
ncbi:NAD(P)-binding protein [Phenylobacterium sp.]|uniref:NAD(P)-binding protein n=1 Tax=Phenylobacterium sp. TaxID=1871053 RepID=UPI004035F1B3